MAEMWEFGVIELLEEARKRYGGVVDVRAKWWVRKCIERCVR